MTIRELFIALGYEVDKNSEAKAEQSIKTLKNTATKVLGAIGIGFSLTQVNAIAEEFNGVNDQIRNATKELGKQGDIQRQVLSAANDTKTAYGYMADLVSNLVQEDKSLFGSVEEAAEFATLTTKLFKTAGKADAEIQGLQEALNKSFAKGKVDTETLNQLYERAPEAINLIAESLGVSKDKLMDMAAEGNFTCADLKNAFVNSADVINRNFNDLDFSITDALLNIRNQWGLWVDSLNSSIGLTQSIGTTMVKVFTGFMDILRRVQTRVEWFVEKLGGVDNFLKLLSITAAALYLAFNFGQIKSGLMSIAKLLGGISLKALAIAAVIVLIALLIEDFAAFMKGEDSLIGAMFDKGGIGAENARQAIFGAWEATKEFLLKTWETIQQVAATIFGHLSDWWEQNGAQVMASFQKIWDAIKTLLATAWTLIKTLAISLFNGLTKFWETWGDTILSVFGIIWNTLLALMKPFMDGLSALIDFIASVFAGDWEGAWEAIKAYATAVWEWITTIIRGAWEIICAIWSKLSEIFRDIFEKAKTAISEKIAAIKETIVDGFMLAIDWIKSLPEQALQWGIDIIQGIVDGIRSTIGLVGDAVKGVADKIKSFLGFSEPEDGPLSNFHTYMPDMIELMAKGISDGKQKVVKALEGITGEMSVVASARLVDPDTISKVGGGGSAGATITQNVEINNKFEGDRAGQEKSSTAMDKSAKDATGEMARAIAFAR